MGRTVPLNEEAKRRAREMYKPGVVGYKQVARALGISETSVRRYVDDDYCARNLRDSLAAKKRRRGVCEKCGGETLYNGRTINGPSKICKTCAEAPRETCKRGHPLIPENRVRIKGSGEMCRLCRNEYMRQQQWRRRRERGVTERGEYRKPKREALLAVLESEGAAS